MAKTRRVPDPTPNEIAKRLAALQRSWTQEERIKRLGSGFEMPSATENEANAVSDTLRLAVIRRTRPAS